MNKAKIKKWLYYTSAVLIACIYILFMCQMANILTLVDNGTDFTYLLNDSKLIAIILLCCISSLIAFKITIYNSILLSLHLAEHEAQKENG